MKTHTFRLINIAPLLLAMAGNTPLKAATTLDGYTTVHTDSSGIGDLDIQGPLLTLGSTVANCTEDGIQFQYTEATNTTTQLTIAALSLYANSSNPALWQWGYASGEALQMSLNENSELALYYNYANHPDPVITLDPKLGEIKIGGAKVLTQRNGLLCTGSYGVSDGFTPPQGAGTRMMWYPEMAAFRAGYVDDTQWDATNIGDCSTAFGYATTASGGASIAIGDGTSATGDDSTAMGAGTTAEGFASTAMGEGTMAEGRASTAIGAGTTANGDYSTAMGQGTIAAQHVSTAMGGHSVALGYCSTAMGFFTSAYFASDTAMGMGTYATGSFSTAMGEYSIAGGAASTAMGYTSLAQGRYSLAVGDNAVATAYSCASLGSFNDPGDSTSATTWVETDPILLVGNGRDEAPSNAIATLKNGQTTLTNKGWKAAQVAEEEFTPSEGNPEGNALVVEGNTVLQGNTILQGNTVLNGMVIIAQPQGDISMGNFGQ